MTSTPPAEYVVGLEDLFRLSIHAERQGIDYVAYVYMGSEIVFTYREGTYAYPAGIEDFAAIAARTFAKRLAALIDGSERSNETGDPVGA